MEAHLLELPHTFEPFHAERDQEKAKTMTRIGVSARGDNDNIGKNPVRYICLSAVQQPMIILLLGARLHSRKITAGARLCHRDSEYLRSEEHTSELQSLMRISYAVFCLKKKNNHTSHNNDNTHNTTSNINKP